MTPADLYDRIRHAAGRHRFSTETLDTDEAALASLEKAFSDEELLPLVWSAADAVAASVKAQHVPDRVRRFTGDFRTGAPLDGAVLRLLETRVYGASGAAPFDAQQIGGQPGAPLLRASARGRRRRPFAGSYAVERGVLWAPDPTTAYDAVATAAATGAADDLGLPDHLAGPVVLHVVAAVFASRGIGRAVTARNAYLRAVRPYLHADAVRTENGAEVAAGEGESA